MKTMIHAPSLLNWVALGSLALFTGGAVMAAPQTASQQTASAHTQADATHRTSDALFAKTAARGGMAEVKLGQLAEVKGDNTTVKDFGKRMVDDHSNANEKLKNVASQDGIELPSNISAHDQALYTQLSKLSGASFDKAYARAMVRDHERDISEFEHEAKNGTDDSVKQFASQTLPTLQEHYRLAETMLRTVNQGEAPGTQTKPSR